MERQLEPRVEGLDQLDVELEHRPDNGKNCQRIEAVSYTHLHRAAALFPPAAGHGHHRPAGRTGLFCADPRGQSPHPRFARHPLPVSYTHLDVYKRQLEWTAGLYLKARQTVRKCPAQRAPQKRLFTSP